MQGTALLAQNPQQGFPPPTGPIEMLSPPPTDSKNPSSNNNDSGIFSTTNNTTIQDTHSDCSTPPNCTTPPNNHSTPSTPPPPGSPNSSDDRKYFCPICETLLTSQHKFTLHIRLHNNETDHQQEKQQQTAGGGYICRICSKVLSSSSSLDRHVLVHSGERPFHCKYCGDTFTTNGNMHRHMRTHNNTECNSASSTESSSDDGGNSSTKIIRNKRTEIELNNNNKNKRMICNSDIENSRKKVRLDSTDSVTIYKCPICERTDFNSKTVLETHLQDNHPDFPSFPTTCNICNMTFNNNKLLNIHKTSVHFPSTNKQPVVGFKDLTFVDFSSEKFPLIAQRECEINLHKAGVTGMKFQCSDCNRGFPCKNSLQIHEVGCKVRIPSVDGFNNKNLQIPDDEIKRKEFFNRLNLLDNNNTSTSSSNKLKQQLLLNSNINYNENNINLVDALLHKKNPIINNNNNSKDLADIQSILTNTTLPTTNNNNDLSTQQQLQEFQKPNNKLDDSQDESQDFFSIEFRKMKLRGEFPCRLCTAVFPNLRALKGHNRAHLNNSNSSSGGTLYECNMCPHSSGDKAALIRHMRSHNGDRPYECSLCNYAFTTKANCERHLRNRHAKSTREEVKRSIIYHPSEDPTNEELNKLVTKDDTAVTMPKKPVQQQLPPLHDDKPVFTTSNKFPPLISTTPPMYPPELQTLKPTKPFILPPHNEIPSFLTPNFTPKIQVKNFQYEPEERDEEDTDEEEEDEPLDLVLDLSKKKVPDVVEEEQPQDLTKKSSPLPITTPSIPQFAQNFLKTPPKIDPATLYATQLALYRTGFPFMNPLLFPPITPPTLPPTHNPHELKERMQRFQMCGGGMIADKTFPGNNPIFPTNINENNSPILLNNYSTPKKMPDMNIEQSPVSPSTKNDHGAVKMVIKNGILMPKQKQRRYRTERPFTCEYCAAKFTLRSNMERHIKQQHPQYWSQRQKSSISTPSSSKKTLNIPTYYDSSTKEKLKFSLLSHQLTKKEEEEEDSPLVIDEIEEEHVPPAINPVVKVEENPEDLVSVSRLLDNASQQQFQEYFKQEVVIGSEEEEEEGLVASGSTSEGTDENKSESETISSPPPPSLSPSSTTTTANTTASSNNNKKKSAYSLAPNRVSCPYCNRKFPWTSSLRRHILTHTGQKPFKCTHCPLLFTTKSNCDRHLLRKHGNNRALTIPNNNNNNTQNNNNFLMRNVPERPFKCSSCPSSTFSTYSNLKKHISNKHYSGNNDDDNNEDDEIVKQQGYEAGSSEDEKYLQNHKITTDTSQYQQQSDLPFKCHLCELSFAERHLCLDHIKIRHSTEYDLLISKNALEPNPVPPQQHQQQHDDDYNDDDVELRGKFPDYSNRKVICAFCLRRFWSAEDLRRHMRTHTGERPFSCDICKRRFTLKHSMLRHRKKHNLNFSLDGNNISDEDGNNENEGNFKNVEINHQGQKEIFSDHEEKHDKKDPKENFKDQEDDSDGVEGVDLISNLLGLRDRTIIDKVLAASADDAAKLLGVKNGVRE